MGLLIIGLCGQSVFLTVPHFHRPEETLHATAMFTEPGGKGYNQAVAAARVGARVTFAGAIGRDADGAACTQRLLDEGIAPRMSEKPERTAYAAILTADNGENRVTVRLSRSKLDCQGVFGGDGLEKLELKCRVQVEVVQQDAPCWRCFWEKECETLQW